MQFFHHPRNADYHKGKTKAVDQPHESMCEPVRQDNTGHISKAIEDIRHQISGQRSRSGRAYQVEPTCDLMADQIAEQCVEPHGNGSHIEHPGRSATHLGHNPEMVCPNSDQQKQNGNRQPISLLKSSTCRSGLAKFFSMTSVIFSKNSCSSLCKQLPSFQVKVLSAEL